MSKPICFVIMGFGEKTDLATGRTLDLDKTYRVIIQKAVEESGLECIRADNIIHSGIIDKPMYELLLDADLVIADLSTANPNAIYELGVRHALRPYTTIVIAEQQFKFPFDIGHLLIRPYEHLGKGIDAEEAERMRNELKKTIATLLAKNDVDSPVHTFLSLQLGRKSVDMALQDSGSEAMTPPVKAEAINIDQEVSTLMELFKEARAESDWRACVRYLKKLQEKRGNDVYIIQQLALAVYKSKSPDPESALLEAHRLLQQLNPKQTTDPETLGLWGAVHKRLWELKAQRKDLDEAIWAYEKGFYLKDDFYNGINFAYLLNERAFVSSGKELIADIVTAERVRKKIIGICEAQLKTGIKNDEGHIDHEQQFWLQATLIEALIGTGDTDRAEEIRSQALGAQAAEAGSWKPEGWMIETMDGQLAKLKHLLSAGDRYEVVEAPPGKTG